MRCSGPEASFMPAALSKLTFLSALWLKIPFGSLTARAFGSQVAALRTELAPLELLHRARAPGLPSSPCLPGRSGSLQSALRCRHSPLRSRSSSLGTEKTPRRTAPRRRPPARPSPTLHREFPPSSSGKVAFLSTGAGFTLLPGVMSTSSMVVLVSLRVSSAAPYLLSSPRSIFFNICTFLFLFSFCIFLCYHAVY